MVTGSCIVFEHMVHGTHARTDHTRTDHTRTDHTRTDHTHTHTHTHTYVQYFHAYLELNRTEIFTVNSVNVFLEWKEEPGVTYTANASPSASLMFIGNAGLQLTLLYNIVYNVNITATLCGQNSIMQHHFKLKLR